MAWAHVQSTSNFTDTTVASFGAAFGANVVAGDLIVVSVGTGADTGTIDLADTVGTSYTRIGTITRDSTDGASFTAFYGYAAASGANTVTASFVPNTGLIRICASQYSGVSGAPVDTDQNANQSATTATDNATSPAATPTATGQLVFSSISATDNAFDFTGGTGFTKRVEDADTFGGPVAHEDRSAPSTSNLSATWTLSASTAHYHTFIAIFAESGGGAPVGRNRSRSMFVT